MEKTFGQMEEVNNEVPQTQSSSQDETSVAVANLTTILECSKSPNGRVRTLLFIFIKLHHWERIFNSTI